jgi:O-antigen/teichoic acid export membrane protein
VESFVSLAFAVLAFLLGTRLGPRGASIALRVSLVAALGFALLARYLNAAPDRSWQAVALSAIAAGVSLMCTIALVGPSVFKRWLYAALLSAGLLFLVRLTVSREMLVSFLTGMAPP